MVVRIVPHGRETASAEPQEQLHGPQGEQNAH